MSAISRRRFLQAGAGGVLLLRSPPVAVEMPARPGMLNHAEIAKYVVPLPIPPAMPPTSSGRGPADRYVIGARQIRRQVLPPGSPATTVWGYGPPAHHSLFNSPACTLEARVDRPVQVAWVNELIDRDGRYLPHLLPVDPTVHWANPPGGRTGRDSRPTFATTPRRYQGPVPIITHLHGGHNADYSDGYPTAWYLPAARNIPSGYASEGSKYADFAAAYTHRHGTVWSPGAAEFYYGNRQRPTTMWFHDHALGITRLSVYAGLVGFYLLRGGPDDLPAYVLPGPAPAAGDPQSTVYYEIPIAIQDRSFAVDGSVFYPESREQFDKFAGPYIPASDVPPIWNPEFFGAAMTVNGRTWPYLRVEPRRYRFRLLNACNARFLNLKIVTRPQARRPVAAALPFWQIGSEGGFLPAPVRLDHVLLAPAERADVLVDFTGIPDDTELYLINEGPDSPFQGRPDTPPADPATTGQVMKFVLKPLAAKDLTVPADQLTLPPFTPLGPASTTREVALIEEDSAVLHGVGPTSVLLGTVHGGPKARMWSDPITENPAVGSTEVWEIHNFTADAHPIHIHEVFFQVINRQPFRGTARPPEPWESGFKDTVIAYPQQITRIKATFDRAGLFVWHCHMLEHEDNEMMRPYRIGP
ncbi:bilirubin oxidase [Sinosporangium album]|uniref:Bilirubin oxidase n=1 Tax=Sinosporangium album TaxID=504805 RepID=A0A1G8CQ90_9ACTN|nr:multicopper oxidase [Sinosporangium album]SDH47513.1 bilirubin oxidase [Sinosporangium album]